VFLFEKINIEICSLKTSRVEHQIVNYTAAVLKRPKTKLK